MRTIALWQLALERRDLEKRTGTGMTDEERERIIRNNEARERYYAMSKEQRSAKWRRQYERLKRNPDAMAKHVAKARERVRRLRERRRANVDE